MVATTPSGNSSVILSIRHIPSDQDIVGQWDVFFWNHAHPLTHGQDCASHQQACCFAAAVMQMLLADPELWNPSVGSSLTLVSYHSPYGAV